MNIKVFFLVNNCQEIVSMFLFAPYLIGKINEHLYASIFQYLYDRMLDNKRTKEILSQTRLKEIEAQTVCYSYASTNLISWGAVSRVLISGVFKHSMVTSRVVTVYTVDVSQLIYLYTSIHKNTLCALYIVYTVYIVYLMYQKFILMLFTIYLFISRYLSECSIQLSSIHMQNDLYQFTYELISILNIYNVEYWQKIC